MSVLKTTPKRYLDKEHLSPSQSIRRYCVMYCMNNNPIESVESCPSGVQLSVSPPLGACPLFPLRLGKDIRSTGASPLKSIRAKCLDCSAGSPDSVRDCFKKDCYLYPYRMGKRPKSEVKHNRNVSPEVKEKRAQRLREYWAKKKGEVK